MSMPDQTHPTRTDDETIPTRDNAQTVPSRSQSWIGRWIQRATITVEDRLEPFKHAEAINREMAQTMMPYVGMGTVALLAVTCAMALVTVSLGFTLSRMGNPYAEWVFWAGMAVLVILPSYRLLSPTATRRERLGIVVLVGMSLYMIKLFHNPTGFGYYDELLHWRTADDILRTGALFGENSLLPVSPLYPGLENATAALVSMTGMPIFIAGALIIGMVRLAMTALVFLFYEQVSQSPRLAGIAAMIYMSNPHFLFFDAQFAYESMALMFGMMALYAIELRMHRYRDRPLELSLVLLMALGAVVITHHVTSYFLLAFLTLWTGVTLLRYQMLRRRHGELPIPLWSLFLAIAATASWMLYVATITIDYLVPVIAGAVGDLFNVIVGTETGRALFSGEAENSVAAWEQSVVYFSTFTILFGIVWGVLMIWLHYRRRPTYIALGLAALAYPATQLLRLTERGPEIASRIGPFLFLGIAFTMAIGMTSLYAARKDVRWKQLLFTALLFSLFMGNALVSFPRWAIFPGEYLAAADVRSVEQESIEAAHWSREYLGPQNRFAADRINGLLHISYGDQIQITGSFFDINIPGVFLAPVVREQDIRTLCEGEVQYLLTDQRFTEKRPMLGFYYEQDERLANEFEADGTISEVVSLKFDFDPRFIRIFDSGNLTIYRVGDIGCES